MKDLQLIYKNVYKQGGKIEAYIKTYERNFDLKPKENICLLQIGIYEGNSLIMWAEYFKNSNIIGLDNALEKVKTQMPYNVKLIEGDFNSKSLYRFLSMYQFDYIIDNSSNLLENKIQHFHAFFNFLKHDGMYFIQDISSIDFLNKDLNNFSKNIEVVDLRENNIESDNILMIIKK